MGIPWGGRWGFLGEGGGDSLRREVGIPWGGRWGFLGEGGGDSLRREAGILEEGGGDP